jgi:hypothetical protein
MLHKAILVCVAGLLILTPAQARIKKPGILDRSMQVQLHAAERHNARWDLRSQGCQLHRVESKSVQHHGTRHEPC